MKTVYSIDANVFITAWRVNYPETVFPSLWVEIANVKDQIVIIKPIYDEIEPISTADNKLSITKKKEKYPLRVWLIDNGFIGTAIDDEIISLSLELERIDAPRKLDRIMARR